MKHDNVFVEKPLALNARDLEQIQEAEKSSRGKLIVDYMRRYATAFEDAVQEVGGLDKILYARVRGRYTRPSKAVTLNVFLDIIGPKSTFVDQSGTFPKAFSDFEPKDTADRDERAQDLMHQALQDECNVPVTESTTFMWRLLGGLGTHDISAMREALRMPLSVLGVSLGFPF